MDKINYKLINFAIIIIIFFFIIKTSSIWIYVLKTIIKIAKPFLISFAIAYFITPIIKIINKKLKNRRISTIIVLLLISGVIFISLYLSLPIIIKQLSTISKSIVPFIENLSTKLNINNYLFIKQELNSTINNAINSLSNNYTKVFSQSLEFLSTSLITIILTVYFLFNMDKIKNKVSKALICRPKLLNILKEIDYSLNNYFKSIIIIIFIEIIEYSLLYFIVGHPNFLLLGFLVGISTIIPYFGPLIVNLLALITAINVSLELFILCSIIALIVPIIDNYVVDPKIYQKTIKLNPLKVILSITIFSTIFGFVGIIIAIPLYIIGNQLLKNIII